MTEHNTTDVTLSPDKVAALLASALRARRSGNISAARALLRVLSADQPDLPQIWLALATVAETRAEQRQALERVAALDPANPLAQRGLMRMGVVPPAPAQEPVAQQTPGAAHNPTPVAHAATRPALDDSSLQSASVSRRTRKGDALFAPLRASSRFLDQRSRPDRRSPGAAQVQAESEVGFAPGFTSHASPDDARAIRWPLYLVIAISILAVLAAALLIRDASVSSSAAAPTPALPGAATAPVVPTQPAIVVATSSPAAENTATLAPTTPPPTVTPPTPAPSATPRPTLAIGEVVKHGIWHAVLLRPDYAVSLDGGIATFQPRGRFVLALVAIGNDGSAPAPVPIDLFALIDQSGTRYAPLPAISTAYLSAYGRGQRGDLSMEDPIPADGGNKSVPLIFDIPEHVRDLYLVVKDSAAGWPVRQ